MAAISGTSVMARRSAESLFKGWLPPVFSSSSCDFYIIAIASNITSLFDLLAAVRCYNDNCYNSARCEGEDESLGDAVLGEPS